MCRLGWCIHLKVGFSPSAWEGMGVEKRGKNEKKIGTKSFLGDGVSGIEDSLETGLTV